jgi:hypothetical protein
MDKNLGVYVRLKDRTAGLQRSAQQMGIDEIAVVTDSQTTERVLDHEGLRVTKKRLAAGRVAIVTDRAVAAEAPDDLLVKDVGDQP